MQLKELVIPSTVTSIGDDAFKSLAALETVVFAEDSQLETLGASVFANCASLKSITLPPKLETLSYGAFSGCTSLESITLPSMLKTIQTSPVNRKVDGVSITFHFSYAFQDCTALKHLDMSACTQLTELPTYLLDGCDNIEALLLPPNLATIHDCAFGNLPYKSGKLTSRLPNLKEITIPASVTSIGGYVFAGCKSLQTVIFEKGSQMTELGTAEAKNGNPLWGQYIFAGTTSLKTVVLPEKLTTIGISCFENSSVTEIDLPSSVKAIGKRAFKNCDNIKDAGLSANLVYLGDEAFYDCDSLETADLAFGLDYLGFRAFAYCRQLKKAYIPATVTGISGNPFMGCTGVESLELDPDSVDFVLVDGVLYDAAMQTLIYYPASLTAETFEIPDTVSQIAAGAFAGARLKSIFMSERITEISSYAFQDSSIEIITLHRGIMAIGDNAFAGMANLKEIFIEGGVDCNMSANAFVMLIDDVNIYFTNYTYDEIVEEVGYAWFTNASRKAHFYFRDTIPEDVEQPK